MKPLPCPPHRWSDFSRLLDLALALPEPERGPWLAALSGPDAELRPHLAQVLASADANAGEAFLSAPRLPPGNPADGLQPGQRVGPYELVNELGRGGMGVVWLARRADGAYARDVALKLPHAHLLVGGVRERFLQERDILASLSHPHIARFYDAGLADDGQPYLALELVHGRPITQWAHDQRLGLPTRIALLGQVMAAVEHAHGKLVAHRDLKPANVLVGADGQARLLDFGIAKLLHFNEAEAANEPLTRSGQRPATPGYAAPEQLTGGTITVATDIFALGAMLFELLTGRMPTRSEPAGTANAALLADPPLPSASIDEAQAQAVGLGPRALRHALAGDLDAIVAKAMSTDPRERYSAVADFAADLARHQRGEPILARRITAAQRGLKFVRRHRAAVTLSTLLGVSLIAGVTGVVWQAQRAQAQARRAEAVKDFLLGVFKASDPRIASDTPRGQITAKALLDASAGQIESRFADDPQVQIELLRTAADIYRELGEDNAYESLEARQIALARKHYGALHPNVLNGMVEAAVRASSRGDNATCRRLLDESDRPITQARLDTDELRATWWSQRSICLRDLPEKEAERDAALQRSLDLYARHAPT
jgi:serine/threonine-protein kinase